MKHTHMMKILLTLTLIFVFLFSGPIVTSKGPLVKKTEEVLPVVLQARPCVCDDKMILKNRLGQAKAAFKKYQEQLSLMGSKQYTPDNYKQLESAIDQAREIARLPYFENDYEASIDTTTCEVSKYITARSTRRIVTNPPSKNGCLLNSLEIKMKVIKENCDRWKLSGGEGSDYWAGKKMSVVIQDLISGYAAEIRFIEDELKKLTCVEPKQLYMEITIKGNGTYNCGPIKTCTWKVDRKYSGTIYLPGFTKVPFATTTSPPGTASAIANANPDTPYNSMWLYPSTDWTDAYTFIDDETKQSWKKEVTRNNKRTTVEVTITDTWTVDETGKGFRGGYVNLDRQTRQYKVLVSPPIPRIDMIRKTVIASDVDSPPRTEKLNVPALFQIEDYLANLIIPIEGVTPNDETASFEKTFPDVESQGSFLEEIPEAKNCKITLYYKFK